MGSDPVDYVPPSPDEDAVTYLPIDKAREARAQVGFGPTDLRGAQATGGMRVGEHFPFVPGAQMGRLKAEEIGQACDNVVRGHKVWASLLYLGRAQADDVAALLEASQSYEIKVRWERLWVLSPYLARIARLPEAQRPLAEALQADVAGLHLVSKFAEQNNPSVKRLFVRLHDLLLGMLLQKLCESVREPRRCALLCSILAAIETQGEALQAALPRSATAEVRAQAMELLYVAPSGPKARGLSSATLRERLQTWRQRT